MDYINDAADSYAAIHDFFQNNGVGDTKFNAIMVVYRMLLTNMYILETNFGAIIL
ncbi:hypothetical protein [Wolbachia endosymbiont of Leptopilina clavipes]|uniref:hypothetical protein n=1 Tax=Wolbachia endosymbiont of Leptopilina clavipes TaxID=260213 RepID=UPI001FEAEF32|nr:hypothetical protein [Wolbachia endosymbiont of Leptopilina clavipes]